MLYTVLAFILPPLLAFKGLRHGLYAVYALGMLAISFARFPSLSYPFWHEYYLYSIGLSHLLLITFVTFLGYGWDKFQARRGGWRVPERTLHALVFMGGTIGALIGSRVFRHKTIKGQFKQTFAAMVILQTMLAFGIIWWYAASTT